MLQDRETITKRKDGRFMGRFIIDHEPNGKSVYQYVYGKSYDEAEQKLRIAREIESNYLSGRFITIKKVYGEWLNAIANRVKESTYTNYTMKFEKHILPYFGEKLCTSINSATINAFIKKKVDSGLSAGYVRDLFTVFKALLVYAQEDNSNSDIMLGAEVAIEHGLHSIPDIDKLRLADTNYILLELPYAGFQHWYLDEITDIAYEYKLTPVIAHIHRYLDYYSKSEYEEVLKLDAIFQINNEAFGNFKERRFVKNLIKEGYPYLFGSDAHNLTDRKPNWDLLQKKVKTNVIDGAEVIL